MSSKAYPKDRTSALEAGAEEFLLKPISPQALMSLLDRLVCDAGLPKSKAAARVPLPLTTIKFWGVRGSIAAPGPATAFYGGNTPCVEVRTKGHILILDAGTGIRSLGAALAAEFKGQPLEVTILLTHTHWDHIQGFPFFAPIYDSKNRIRILGYEGAREGLAKILSSQMESPHFPVGLNDLPGHICIEELKDLQFAIGGLKVRTGFANHPGICVGYRLETDDGAIVYLPDNEPYLRPSPAVASGETLPPAQTERQKMLEFLHQAEVLILDAQYDLAEYKSHQGWGHGCVEHAVELALQAQVRQLYLFHHDPDHNDQKIGQMVETARRIVAQQGGQLAIEAAREGESLEVTRI